MYIIVFVLAKLRIDSWLDPNYSLISLQLKSREIAIIFNTNIDYYLVFTIDQLQAHQLVTHDILLGIHINVLDVLIINNLIDVHTLLGVHVKANRVRTWIILKFEFKLLVTIPADVYQARFSSLIEETRCLLDLSMLLFAFHFENFGQPYFVNFLNDSAVRNRCFIFRYVN